MRKFDNEEHEAYIREHSDVQPDEDYEMDLKESDRKKLWALAGNKCSLCNSSLVLEDNTIVGEECHISSAKPSHRSKKNIRYDSSLKKNERDSYANAILLCANCHKKIDNSDNTQYTIDELHKIKEKHETKVKTFHKNTEIESRRIIREEESKRREELKSCINKHNEDLIKNVFEKWGFAGEGDILPDDRQNAIDHLHSGYREIWNTYLKDNSLEIPPFMTHDAKYYDEKTEIIAKRVQFRKRLDKIVVDFKKSHVELDGHCSRCKTWKKDLAYL